MRLGTYYRSRLFRLLGLNEVNGRVLDIGGFDGYWVASLRCESCLVDVHPEPIHPGVRYFRADGMRLPFRDAVFDVVFGFDVIEHVPDERQLISEALRVLRPGGRLILTTPNVSVQVFPKLLQPWVNRRWGHDRVPGFSPEHLTGILETHSLADVRIKRLATSAFRCSYLPLSLVWRLPGPFGRWWAAAGAAWDARHLEGDRGSVLVQVTR
jgi:SAM-dependent methyltransferase